MASKTHGLDADLQDYVTRNACSISSVAQELISDTRSFSKHDYQVSVEQFGFLRLLARLLNAKSCLELGTFTGLSALALAEGVTEDGFVDTVDVNKETTDFAQNYWLKAGLQHKIRAHIEPAKAFLDRALLDPTGEPYDLVFIDAVKSEFEYYYECAVRLTRSGGVIAIDNVFRQGRVTNTSKNVDPGTDAVRRLTQKILRDNGTFSSMIPIGDGLTIVQNQKGEFH
ncbi:MAG: class I SAM-dependent methyltransferase [Pseudomonadota bacterium]